jgi:hypothetical protein
VLSTNASSAKLEDVTRILSELKADFEVAKLPTPRMRAKQLLEYSMLNG